MDDASGSPRDSATIGSVNTRLEAMLVAQGGVCTTAQALACELSEADLAGSVRRGALVRVRRDAFVVGDRWAAATPEGRLALRAKAVMLGRARAVASHQAALALHQLPLWSVELDRVDLMVDTPRVRRRGGLRLHPRLPSTETVRAQGMTCLPVATAIVQVALERGVAAGLVPLDGALRARRCTLDEVAEALRTMARTPVRRKCGEQLLRLADPVCESVGETRTRLLLHDMGLPYETQVDVTDLEGRFVGRVDFVVLGKVVVEFDGLVKYEGIEGRAALAAEKRREDALRRLGYGVARLVWSDLDDPGRVAELIAVALATSSRPGTVGGAGKP